MEDEGLRNDFRGFNIRNDARKFPRFSELQ
jgi:hypothetical protein